MQKKINLITIHYSLSPGAVMQTYALCKFLKDKGISVTIINFKNNIEKKRRRSLRFWISSGIVKLRFDLFRNKFLPPRTKEMFSLNYDSLPPADAYLSGSDQIWNPNIVGDNLSSYMLGFLPNHVKRFSYASSLGVNDWNFSEELTLDVKKNLSKYKKISIREISGVKICENKFQINATNVLDPTLLLEDYSELIPDAPALSNELVIFKLVQDDEFYKVVAYLKRELKCITSLLYTNRPRKEFDKSIMFCSPQKWLYKIASAKFVLTDSFHGLAFCLIFKKNFIILGGPKGKTTRLKSLLTILHLEERYVDTLDEIKEKPYLLTESINYIEVDSLLADERKKSNAYLDEILELI